MALAAPRVTVIIPTYNWSAVLPFSIGSALDQSFEDFELIVVGDGCTDDSAEVVAAIGDPRVQWVNLPENSGHQSTPNNEGLRRARGELIAYLGHDDLWLPHHLACLVAAIDAGADVAFGITRMVPARFQALTLIDAYRPGGWIAPTATIHRRALTERVGGWRDYRGLVADPESDLWSRFHVAGAQFDGVKRLTAVKFPAAARRDVYREKPSHEQAAWLARIRQEPDFEATELSRIVLEMAAARREPSYHELIRKVLRRTVSGVGRRLGRPASNWKAGERVGRFRANKGLAAAASVPGGEQ